MQKTDCIVSKHVLSSVQALRNGLATLLHTGAWLWYTSREGQSVVATNNNKKRLLLLKQEIHTGVREYLT